MQFPTIPPNRIAPVARRDVTAIEPARASVRSERQSAIAAPIAGETPPPPAPVAPERERPQADRRESGDRRKRQVPVLLDTRTGGDRRARGLKITA